MPNSGGNLRLRWSKAPRGYVIKTRPFSLDFLPDAERTVVIPKGLEWDDVLEEDGFNAFRRTLSPYQASIGEYQIYSQLANTPRTPDGVLKFVDQWGLLYDLLPWVGLESFYAAIATMKSAIDDGNAAIRSGRPGADTAAVKRLNARLTNVYQGHSGPEGFAGLISAQFDWEARAEPRHHKPRLIFAATSLWQFCLLEHLQAIAGGVDIKTCENKRCGKYLRLPKGGGRAPRHCDDTCRQAARRQRLAEDARLRKKRPSRASRSRH